MTFVEVSVDAHIATVVLRRGKVNALSPDLVRELHDRMRDLASDASTHAVVLTGSGAFFSFGFDVPELIDHSPADFTAFVTAFTDLYTDLFLFPKPLVMGLNGHAVAGGCMIALAGDRRIMTAGRSRISLNEITFGASVFAGSVEMLRHAVGGRQAEAVLLTGSLYSPEEAHNIGLVDEVVPTGDLPATCVEVATKLSRYPEAFASIKALTRGPIGAVMREREPGQIARFVEIWYSPAVRAALPGITIRS